MNIYLKSNCFGQNDIEFNYYRSLFYDFTFFFFFIITYYIKKAK